MNDEKRRQKWLDREEERLEKMRIKKLVKDKQYAELAQKMNNCPVCGRNEPKIVKTTMNRFYVLCPYCRARTTDTYQWPEEAILEWNWESFRSFIRLIAESTG